jgi:hypothetical protein
MAHRLEQWALVFLVHLKLTLARFHDMHVQRFWFLIIYHFVDDVIFSTFIFDICFAFLKCSLISTSPSRTTAF